MFTFAKRLSREYVQPSPPTTPQSLSASFSAIWVDQDMNAVTSHRPPSTNLIFNTVFNFQNPPSILAISHLLLAPSHSNENTHPLPNLLFERTVLSQPYDQPPPKTNKAQQSISTGQGRISFFVLFLFGPAGSHSAGLFRTSLSVFCHA